MMAKFVEYARRLGCALALLLWFSLLLLPCALFTLARNGEITLFPSEIPGDSWLRVRLLLDDGVSGLSFTTSNSQRNENDRRACVSSTVHYWLWRGEGTGITHYCECYHREATDQAWRLAMEEPAVNCEPD